MNVRQAIRVVEADGLVSRLDTRFSQTIQARGKNGARYDRRQTVRRSFAWDLGQYLEAGWPDKGHAMRYAVVIENAGKNYSAYVPDLPGCIATGATVAEIEVEIREAIRFHIEGLREDGLPIPQPQSLAQYVDA